MVSIPVIPYSVAIGAEVDVVSVSSINPSIGGFSGRQKVRDPLRQFVCTVGPADTPAVRAIHYTHRQKWPVAIRDWGDYIFEDEELVYSADGSDFLAPLRRLIQPAPSTRYFHQRVLLPDELDTPVVLKIDGSPISRGSWTFDNYGIARVPSGLLSSGGTLTWSGKCLVPVMFMDGTLSVQINVQQETATEYGVQSIQQVRFMEIIEEELIASMLETDDSL
jgi:hypothetical protein